MTDEEKHVDEMKKLVRAMVNDKELINTQAEHTRKLYLAYLNQGFTPEQAVKFICAAFGRLG